MKKTSVIFISISLVLMSCEKEVKAPLTPATRMADNGPYGLVSNWKSIGGDTIFEEELTLTLFYTEKHSPCDICHYQLNYSPWNDYDFTYSASKCAVPNDTLVMTDIATAKKAFFIRVKK